MYNNGNYVTWASQASGGYVRKVGQIIYVLHAYKDSIEVKKELCELYNAIAHFDGSRRGHTSYIVLVTNGSRKPKLYHPKVANLHPYFPKAEEVG